PRIVADQLRVYEFARLLRLNRLRGDPARQIGPSLQGVGRRVLHLSRDCQTSKIIRSCSMSGFACAPHEPLDPNSGIGVRRHVYEISLVIKTDRLVGLDRLNDSNGAAGRRFGVFRFFSTTWWRTALAKPFHAFRFANADLLDRLAAIGDLHQLGGARLADADL